MASTETDQAALAASLQQRYIELLEKRISQLEADINRRDEAKDAKPDAIVKEKGGSDDGKTTGGSNSADAAAKTDVKKDEAKDDKEDKAKEDEKADEKEDSSDDDKKEGEKTAEKKDGEKDDKPEDKKDNKDEKKDEKKDDKKDDKDEKDPKNARYRNALREWDKGTAAYKDQFVAESLLKKEKTENIAYTFRRVILDIGVRGERRAYSELEIEDPALVLLLKEQIDNKYPGVNFDGERIHMTAPFPALIHNWERLQERAKKDPDSQPSKDLAHLLGRVQTAPELEDYFRTREANAAGKVTTFETLWTVFAPKTLIVVKSFMNKPQLLQVSSSPIPSSRVAIAKFVRLWMVAWAWDWNGKRMVKVYYYLKFKRFRGTKQISELDFYPLSYYKDRESQETLCRTIRERSLKFLLATRFMRPGVAQMFQYDGSGYVARRKVVGGEDEEDEDEGNNDSEEEEEGSSRRTVPIKGNVIADAGAFLQYAGSNKSSYALGDLEYGYIEEPWTEIDDVFHSMTLSQAEEAAAITVRPDDVPSAPSSTVSTADSHDRDILILPPRFLGYATREKMWGQFFIDDTRPPPGPRREKFEEKLQLAAEYKDLIAALVKSHEDESEKSSSRYGSRKARKGVEDLVHDKGKGLVLLLHGPPGVGKTLTAETIAEATGKPLFIVSVAEIGLNAEKAERSLERLFALATKWQAILLVDEADVFLETRGATVDASRNALVSVLLRVLEYYKGIIILTTNRIKSIDVAVISRIHLAIRYTDLDDRQMKNIFKHFLDQLMPDQISNRYEIDRFIDKMGHIYGLNGRQIRNVVSAALATARHNATKGIGDGRLTDDDLRRVCESTREFQEQLKDTTMLQRSQNEAGGRMRGW